jgi:hypothetical protein
MAAISNARRAPRNALQLDPNDTGFSLHAHAKRVACFKNGGDRSTRKPPPLFVAVWRQR